MLVARPGTLATMAGHQGPDGPHRLRGWWWGVVLYGVVATVWIVASDLLLFRGQAPSLALSVVKGLGFVLVTGVVVAVVLGREHRRLEEVRSELDHRADEVALFGELTRDLLYHVELEPEQRFVFVSRAAEHLVGYTPQEHLDDPQLGARLVHPDDLHLLANPAALQGTQRLRWYHRDGHVVWTEQSNQPVHRGGRLVALIGTARDVSPEVLAARLRDAMQQLETDVLLDERSIRHGLAGFAHQLAAVLESAEVTVSVAWGRAGRDERRASASSVTAADVELPVRFEARQGAVTLTLRLAADALSPAAVGPIVPSIAHQLDVIVGAVDRRRELRRVQQALSATASAAMLTDREGRIEWVNPAFTRITGYLPDEAIGQTPRLLKSGEHPLAFYERMWSTISSGRSFADRLTDRRKDGSTYVAEVTIDPVLDADGTIEGYIGVQKDITAEEAVRSQLHRRELETLARERDLEQDRALLVQTISHELRTPLTVVTGVAETLGRDDLPAPARERLVGSLHRASDQLLSRLDVLFAATDGVDGPPTQTSGRSLIEGALSRLRGRQRTDRVQVNGDARWFGHAILAQALLRPVLDNALEYAPDHTPVEVELRRSDGRLVVVIRDHGPGIAPEFLPLLEEPFQQADPGRTRSHGGLGLGLYAARRAASRLDATMELESGPDGTTVTMQLPDTPELVREPGVRR